MVRFKPPPTTLQQTKSFIESFAIAHGWPAEARQGSPMAPRRRGC
jgi:hypothetical protein